MILIADTHAGAEGSPEEFFEMLEFLALNEEPIVFLGDVFDLWIGLRRYETETHARFLSWCKSQLPHRSIGLIEGNHEFYISEQHPECFSWVTDTEHQENDILFSHGDLVNTDDTSYIRFRRLMRNSFTKWFAALLPFGPYFSHIIKRKSKDVNHEFRGVFPEDAMQAYVKSLAKRDIAHAFLGHFHSDYQAIPADGCTVHMIPGWFVRGEVARFESNSGRIEVGYWRDLINAP